MANGRGTKRRLYAEDPTCWYCGCMTWLDRNQPRNMRAEQVGLNLRRRDLKRALLGRMATLEHLVRKADGGRTSPGNCVIACHDCNGARGTIPPDVWRVIRRGDPMTDTTDPRGQPTMGEIDARTLLLRKRVDELEAIARTQGELIARIVGRLEERAGKAPTAWSPPVERMQPSVDAQTSVTSPGPEPRQWSPADLNPPPAYVISWDDLANMESFPESTRILRIQLVETPGETAVIPSDLLARSQGSVMLPGLPSEEQRELGLRYEHGDPFVFRVDLPDGTFRYEACVPPSGETIEAATRNEFAELRRSLDERMAERGMAPVEPLPTAARPEPFWTYLTAMLRGRKTR